MSKTVLFLPEIGEVDSKQTYEFHHKTIMEELGVTAIFAYSAKEAREILKSADIDIIVSGLGMSPQEWYQEGENVADINTGFRVIGEFREDPKYADTPIIIRTMYASKGGLETKCEEVRVKDFLIKPVLDANLTEVILKYL